MPHETRLNVNFFEKFCFGRIFKGQLVKLLKLIVIHFHFRPGGIRRVIELAVPHLAREFSGSLDTVVLAGGEPPPPAWLEHFRDSLPGTRVEVMVEPAFLYLSEQSDDAEHIAGRLRRALGRLLGADDGARAMVWLHNPGIARNLLLVRELDAACASRRLPLIFHHHDWWFDNRWQRWRELQRHGIRTLSAAAQIIFPRHQNTRHLCINHADARVLKTYFQYHAGWLPNLKEAPPKHTPARLRFARKWLGEQLGDDKAPVWLMPCRLLRRKNIAEGLLLTRWLRPRAWLATTGGASSADELPYAERLAAAAQHYGWRLHLSVLAGGEKNKPGVAELMSVCEATLLTSLQEGFGLPFLEAAVARRPLMARSIPNITPDLHRFGFRFAQLYEEVWINPELFDWNKEAARQRELFHNWLKLLPSTCQRRVGRPALLLNNGRPHPVPFSRLTLSAQIEVLAQPPEVSWERCAPLNRFLYLWKNRIERGILRATPWPKSANAWLAGKAYARRFKLLTSAEKKTVIRANAGTLAQEQFIREKLRPENLYPLLWAPVT